MSRNVSYSALLMWCSSMYSIPIVSQFSYQGHPPFSKEPWNHSSSLRLNLLWANVALRVFCFLGSPAYKALAEKFLRNFHQLNTTHDFIKWPFQSANLIISIFFKVLFSFRENSFWLSPRSALVRSWLNKQSSLRNVSMFASRFPPPAKSYLTRATCFLGLSRNPLNVTVQGCRRRLLGPRCELPVQCAR